MVQPERMLRLVGKQKTANRSPRAFFVIGSSANWACDSVAKVAFAIVEIDAFTKPIATAFARALKEKLAGARGLVLDLRSNGGGDAEAMSDIASSFLNVGNSLGIFTDRAGTSFMISTHSKSLFTPVVIQQTKLPLVVLTSERTASAAEILVEALRASRRATVIGTANLRLRAGSSHATSSA